jgi:putative transposase
MPRLARIVVPEIPHHVTQRGNRRQRTFFSADDYRVYLELLKANAKAFGFDVWNYCLMPNHVHLLVVPRSEDSLRNGIASLHAAYTRRINYRQDWQGHLWQGRFFSCPVQPEYAAIVARYIELNPVRANLCQDPSDYAWSSAKYSCGYSEQRSPAAVQVGNWAEFLAAGDGCDLTSVRKHGASGRPFGNEHFVRDLEGRTGRTLLPRKRGPKGALKI